MRQAHRATQFLLYTLLFLPLIVGCDGCRRATTEDDKKDENAPRTAYTARPAMAYPADRNIGAAAVKPGHWTTASQSLRSNQSDVRGELRSQASMRIMDDQFEQVGTKKTGISSRPVVLPKGQMRRFEYRIRIPIPISTSQTKVSLNSQFVPRSGGLFDSGLQKFEVMKGTEYFFIVLSSRTEQFAKLQNADWTGSPGDELFEHDRVSNYRMVFPHVDDLLPLPETMLDMTNTSVILWDNLSEDALTPLQQTAILDWIRFGGRLIVNGSDAAEAMANTKLAGLLPLAPTGNVELSHEGAEELMRQWSVPTDRSLEKQIEFLKSESSRIALDGQLHPDASPIDKTGSLILKRRVGRGTVIQSRFDLTEPWIDSWDSYQSFVNGVILGRPPRQLTADTETSNAAFTSADFSRNRGNGDEDDLEGDEEYFGMGFTQTFVGTNLQTDPAVNTDLRLASRDAAFRGGDSKFAGGKLTSKYDPYSRVDPLTGISAWSDTSETMQMFQGTLTDEAGIEIPGSSLVIKSLAWYLIVLVPLNYLIFRILGRLEYAWLAVPVIAIGGAAFAARQAQLDIGFARSNTELALVEAHAGYPRAHVARMIAVYNSLAGRYRVEFKTIDGVAATLENEANRDQLSQTEFQTSFDEGPSLANFGVPSNRMRFLHCENILDLGGSVLWKNNSVINDTDLELFDAVVVRKSTAGDFESSLVGQIEPGEAVEVKLEAADAPDVPSGLPMRVSNLIREFAASDAIPPGATRLIARYDGSMPGMEIQPLASQRTAQSIVMVHLEYEKQRKPGIDKNLVTDFRNVRRNIGGNNKDNDVTDEDTSN